MRTAFLGALAPLFAGLPASAEMTPAGVSLGQDLAGARPLLEIACARMKEVRYTGAMAAPAKETQTQIDCYDMLLYGRPRKVEFLFNDGVLAFFWVLLEPSELDAINAQFETEYGMPVGEVGDFRIFDAGTTAIRQAPPEVLVATREMMFDITGFRAPD